MCLPPEVVLAKFLKVKYFAHLCVHRTIILFRLLGGQKPRVIFIVQTFLSQKAEMSGSL